MNIYRRFVFLLVLVVFFIPYPSMGYPGVWRDFSTASELEELGQLEKASVLWHKLAVYFEENDHTNAAIFHKKLGMYYDSIEEYSNAVYHYEREYKYWKKAGREEWGFIDLERASHLKTESAFYRKVDETEVDLALYEPKSGYYMGIYCEHDRSINNDLTKVEEEYGQHQYFMYYQEWNGDLRRELFEEVKEENTAILIAMQSSKGGLEAIEVNEWLMEWIRMVQEINIPVFLRFLSEMNGDWVKWHGNPSLYIEKFRLVAETIHQYTDNVAMVWAPNDVPIITENGHRIEDYYPGDAYVDWVAVNFYIDYWNSGDTSLPNNHFQNPIDKLDYIYNLYAESKPIMVGEMGIAHYSITGNRDLTEWGVANMKKFFYFLPLRYPRVKAVTYFSFNQGDPYYPLDNIWYNYDLSQNQRMKENYRNILQSDMIAEFNHGVGFTYEQICECNLNQYDEIYLLIKITDYTISKIEYYVDGRLVQTDHGLPYVLKYDLDNASNLFIKVYNSEGLLAKERSISF